MQDNANTSRLMSIGEASEYLGVSIDTLRRWEKKKRIEPLRSPGGHRYYSKDDLDALFGKRYTRDAETLRRTDEELGRVETQEVAAPPISPPVNITPATQVVEKQTEPEVIAPASTGYTETVPELPKAEIAKPEPISSEWKEPVQSILDPIKTSVEPQKTEPAPFDNAFSLPNITLVQNDDQSRLLTNEEIEKRVNTILKTDGKGKSKTNIILGIFSSLILLADVILLYLWAMSAKIISPIP